MCRLCRALVRKIVQMLSVSIALCGFAFAQGSKAESPTPLKGLDFLVGTWVGEGSGDPGKGSGEFTFKHELDNRVLLRNNFAEYPATADRPAFRHDDLMITYSEAGALKAIYFDSEGHVIRYNVTATPNSVVFLSEPSGPVYRLSYLVKDPTHVAIKFEIAPPDKPNEFKTYIEATARRK